MPFSTFRKLKNRKLELNHFDLYNLLLPLDQYAKHLFKFVHYFQIEKNTSIIAVKLNSHIKHLILIS